MIQNSKYIKDDDGSVKIYKTKIDVKLLEPLINDNKTGREKMKKRF